MTSSNRVADGEQGFEGTEEHGGCGAEAAAYTVLWHCEAPELICWPLVQIGLYPRFAIHHKLAVFDLHMWFA